MRLARNRPPKGLGAHGRKGGHDRPQRIRDESECVVVVIRIRSPQGGSHARGRARGERREAHRLKAMRDKPRRRNETGDAPRAADVGYEDATKTAIEAGSSVYR